MSLFFPAASGQHLRLSDEQQSWLAERIFQNECGSRSECLTSWNQGEEFPSLGIGHFIWYPAGHDGIYTESFPALLQYMQNQGVSLPAWLAGAPAPAAPWQTREAFYEDIDSGTMIELRQLLEDTMAVQAAFIVERQRRALPDLLAGAEPAQRPALAELYQALETEAPPWGAYALIDYINFKGEGVSPLERYNGAGWGLLQVLQQMLAAGNEHQPLLQRFSDAAKTVLERRVANAPPERNELRWLAGWFNRVDTYIPALP